MLHIIIGKECFVFALLWANSGQGECQTAASSMWIHTPPPLHAPSGGEAGKSVSGNTIVLSYFSIQETVSIWITTGEIKEIDAGENDEEAA